MKLLINKKQLEHESFWLLAIAGGLMAVHQHLIYRQSGSISTEALVFWVAALSITWRRRHTLDLESNLLSSSIGLILIAWMLLRSFLWKESVDIFNDVTPLISTLGLCLISSDIKNIKQYWREIIVVGLSSFPFEAFFLSLSIPNWFTAIDAKFSSYLLWYAGFDVSRIGTHVILPTGIIQVDDGCTSFFLIWRLLQLSLVFCLIFWVRPTQRIALFLAAATIGFIIGGLRLCLMALIVANNNQAAFEYWHGRSGAEIFTTVAFLLFGCCCLFVTRDRLAKKQRSIGGDRLCG